MKRSPFRYKGKPHKPAAVKRHHQRVAELPCLVCEWRDPDMGTVTVHHVRGYADKAGSITKNDWLVVPLCPAHHLIQFGPRWSVEALNHQRFFQVHGVDLLAEAKRLRDESMAMEAAA